MNYESHLATILAAPEDDAPRLAFATSWRQYDEPLAEFIKLQLQRAQLRRAAGSSNAASAQEELLLRTHGTRWAHTIAKYARKWEFDRGFIASIVVEPHVFLEYGSWLLRNAPIRHVGFSAADDGPFPLQELLASPLLEHFDSLDLSSLDLGDPEIAKLAASPHLTRCLSLDLSHNPLGFQGFRALAAAPWSRKLFQVHRSGGGRNDYTPGQKMLPSDREDAWGAAIWEWAPLGADGQSLEREFGYIPWLHPEENACDRFDARWFFERGTLPKNPSGQMK